MSRISHVLVAATVTLTGLLAGVALAGHIEPGSAKKVSMALVNSFFRCDSPNTTTQSGDPGGACTPAIPANAFGCGFTPTGSGKLTITVAGNAAVGTQTVKVGVVAKGLNANCEADQLCVVLSYRATSDDCAEGSCTTSDIEELEFGGPPDCCVVTGGVCKIKTTLLAARPGTFSNGRNTGIELHGCGLKPLFPLGAAPVAACGILVK